MAHTIDTQKIQAQAAKREASKQAELVEALLAQLDDKLERLRIEHEKCPTDWSVIGEMAHMAEALGLLVKSA